jgi:hypothetical protein
LFPGGAGGELFNLGFGGGARPFSGIGCGLKLRHPFGCSSDAGSEVAPFQLDLAEGGLGVVDNLDLTVAVLVETAKIVTEAAHGLCRLGRITLRRSFSMARR